MPAYRRKSANPTPCANPWFQLTVELRADLSARNWQAEHGLYLGDVPENLTTNEREWLRAFIQRWNAACDLERASAVAA